MEIFIVSESEKEIHTVKQEDEIQVNQCQEVHVENLTQKTDTKKEEFYSI